MTKRTVTRAELDTPMLPYEEAVGRVLEQVTTLPSQLVALRDARGLAIAERIVAGHDVPGFDNSAMDGYAIRSADTAGASPSSPRVLRLIEDLPAGTAPQHTVEPGTASKIMTGAPVPPGADAVVPWEDTEPRAGEVAVLAEIPVRKHVRPRGEDLKEGDEVIAPGTVLRPVHLGVIASVGRSHVQAIPKPRVAVLSTGDELVAAGGELAPGKVFDANQALIAALCEEAGASVTLTGLVGDEPKDVIGWLEDAAGMADLIVTSGGASVGEHDWLRDVLERYGELNLWRVAIKPGKPVAMGRIARAPVIALPGNPGSAFVGVHVFVAAAIRKLAGRDPAPRSMRALLTEDVKGSPSRTLFCRVRVAGTRAVPLPAQSSVVLSNIIPTEGFAIVPPGGLPAGSEVRVEFIGDGQ
ncbi:MAG: molybdopterin molybdotransferase MoeA [Actinomycetota bacterium]